MQPELAEACVCVEAVVSRSTTEISNSVHLSSKLFIAMINKRSGRLKKHTAEDEAVCVVVGEPCERELDKCSPCERITCVRLQSL